MPRGKSLQKFCEAARELTNEILWMLDRSDPLRQYNQKFTWAFTRWRLQNLKRLQPQLLHTEGHLLKTQARFIQHLMRRNSSVREVMEIGFNAGHSSYLFLSTRPDVRVVSFDLGDHEYVDLAKRIIDSTFPGRHELIKGDSRKTVPAFADAHRGRSFDLIYIDGGHDYEVAKADIENCQRLSTPQSLVVMDDLVALEEWGMGPVRAWREAQEQGRVQQDLLLEDGLPLLGLSPEDIAAPSGHVWAVGRYLETPQPRGT
jgi:predicted O-methyltransferase YrrM